MLRRVLNFIIIGVILWLAAKFFPEVVQIDSLKTLVIAVILLWVIQIIVVALSVGVMALGIAAENAAWVIVSIIMIFGSQAIALWALSANLNGFMVAGFWPKIVISICYSLFAISAPKKDDD